MKTVRLKTGIPLFGRPLKASMGVAVHSSAAAKLEKAAEGSTGVWKPSGTGSWLDALSRDRAHAEESEPRALRGEGTGREVRTG